MPPAIYGLMMATPEGAWIAIPNGAGAALHARRRYFTAVQEKTPALDAISPPASTFFPSYARFSPAMRELSRQPSRARVWHTMPSWLFIELPSSFASQGQGFPRSGRRFLPLQYMARDCARPLPYFAPRAYAVSFGEMLAGTENLGGGAAHARWLL